MTFDIKALDDNSYTFGLIGVNEAGKSSILKAMALKDSVVGLKPNDFKEKGKNVEILFKYKLDISDNLDDYNSMAAGDSVPTVLSSQAIQVDDIVGFKLSYKLTSPNVPIYEFLHSKKKLDLAVSVVITKASFEKVHRTVFWTAKDEYLISDAINLTDFATKPESSIPLKNSFGLAGINVSGIPQAIANFSGDTTEKKLLEEKLSEAVTGHISKVWPGHPVKIIFDIDGQIINFHVIDTKAGGKAKTADQRSDGFKQFISFLLTVSAEDSNEELNNCLLLLDEPETHLHPQAQIYFLDELKKITINNRGNVVLFATHSNYMIDKDKLTRNFKVTKEIESTSIELIDTKNSTYASVNYEVFGVVSVDYHCELYSNLYEKFQEIEGNEDKGIKLFDREFFQKTHGHEKKWPWLEHKNEISLPSYIRNCISHPENKNTYKPENLVSSIELMRSIIKK